MNQLNSLKLLLEHSPQSDVLKSMSYNALRMTQESCRFSLPPTVSSHAFNQFSAMRSLFSQSTTTSTSTMQITNTNNQELKQTVSDTRPLPNYTEYLPASGARTRMESSAVDVAQQINVSPRLERATLSSLDDSAYPDNVTNLIHPSRRCSSSSSATSPPVLQTFLSVPATTAVDTNKMALSPSNNNVFHSRCVARPLPSQQLREEPIMCDLITNNTKKSSKFECDICHKLFSNAANMRRHRVRHTGVKPFQCNHCGKRFFRKDHMREHMNHKHNNSHMHCYFCRYEFNQEQDMFEHVVQAHQINPQCLSCAQCQYAATTIGQLLSHLTMSHPRQDAPSNNTSAAPRKRIRNADHSRKRHQRQPAQRSADGEKSISIIKTLLPRRQMERPQPGRSLTETQAFLAAAAAAAASQSANRFESNKVNNVKPPANSNSSNVNPQSTSVGFHDNLTEKNRHLFATPSLKFDLGYVHPLSVATNERLNECSNAGSKQSAVVYDHLNTFSTCEQQNFTVPSSATTVENIVPVTMTSQSATAAVSAISQLLHSNPSLHKPSTLAAALVTMLAWQQTCEQYGIAPEISDLRAALNKSYRSQSATSLPLTSLPPHFYTSQGSPPIANPLRMNFGEVTGSNNYRQATDNFIEYASKFNHSNILHFLPTNNKDTPGQTIQEIERHFNVPSTLRFAQPHHFTASEHQGKDLNALRHTLLKPYSHATVVDGRLSQTSRSENEAANKKVPLEPSYNHKISDECIETVQDKNVSEDNSCSKVFPENLEYDTENGVLLTGSSDMMSEWSEPTMAELLLQVSCADEQCQPINIPATVLPAPTSSSRRKSRLPTRITQTF